MTRISVFRQPLRLLAGLAALAVLLLWGLGTEPVLHWTARQIERLSDGHVRLRDVEGSLYGPLHIGEVRYRGADSNVEAQSLDLDWSPLRLLSGTIEISHVSLGELRISETGSAAPSTALPARLRLPLAVTLPHVRVRHLVAGGVALDNVDFGLKGDTRGYRLDLRRLDSPWGQGRGELAMGGTRPFGVSGHGTWAGSAPIAYRADFALSGSLERLALRLQASAAAGRVNIAARLAPFERQPVMAADIEAHRLDPSVFDKGLPKAAIDATVSVARDQADTLQGTLTLGNALPGRVDAARLPLCQARAHIALAGGRIDLTDLRLDLGPAGHLRGMARLDRQGLDLALNTADLDPHGLYGRLWNARLSGHIRVQAGARGRELSAELAEPRIKLSLDAREANRVIEFRQATIRSGSGSLSIAGRLALDGRQPFQFSGRLANFNPRDFGDYPDGRISGSLSGTGQLAPEPQAKLAFAIAGSQLRRLPLSGQGRLQLSARRLSDASVDLRLGPNRLHLEGALGESADHLAFAIEADDLSALAPELHGRGRITGHLSGRFADPSGNVTAQLDHLAWGRDYRIGTLEAEGHLDQGLDGPLALTATLTDLETPALNIEHARLDAGGSRSRQTLQLQAKGTDLDLDARLAGSWQESGGWFGRLLTFNNRGRYPLALQAPAGLELAAKRFRLDDARFDVSGARVDLGRIAYDAGRIESRGSFEDLAAAQLAELAAPTAEFSTDLVLDGNWQFSVGQHVDGHVALSRRRGDVSILTEPKTSLGLERLALDIDAVDDRLHVRLDARGTHLGSVSADARTTLSRRDGRWGIAGDAPVQATIDASVDSLAWLEPLLGAGMAPAVDGQVTAKLAGGGSFAHPALTGNVSGERLSLALPDQGMNFRNGHFAATLRDSALELQSFAIQGGDGRLTAHGRAVLDGASAKSELSFTAEKFELLSRPDRQLVVSGGGQVSISDKKLELTAKLRADRGTIELAGSEYPTLSPDVVVLGRTEKVERKRPPYAIGFDLDLDLGDHFSLEGRGLDAQLAGAAKLTGSLGALPRAQGTIRVKKGTYSAYGQQLDVERGILNFQGPVDNPGLNILAVRKHLPVEAGVAITGTAQAPQVKLVSTPDLPDSAKLSWLVLGHGLDDASGKDAAALQAAAAVLLGNDESIGLQQRIAHAFGLEEVSVRSSASLPGTVLTLGKRLSSRAYLSYEQGLTGAGTLLRIEYMLSKRLSVRAQTGTTSAADLFYTFSFD